MRRVRCLGLGELAVGVPHELVELLLAQAPVVVIEVAGAAYVRRKPCPRHSPPASGPVVVVVEAAGAAPPRLAAIPAAPAPLASHDTPAPPEPHAQ